MALSVQFLDDLKSRVLLSSLIGRTVKLDKAGREFKACCPFHQEKTPSFTVVDEKGFYHCHGCGAHGDAIRWMTDHGGLPFMEAVRELAGQVGLEIPGRTPEETRREATAATASDVLAQAGQWFGQVLRESPPALAALAERGVTEAAIERFGLGFAHGRRSVSGCGLAPAVLARVGLMQEVAEGREAGLWRDRFRNRLIIPIHDARGRAIGFGARAMGDAEPKYLNSSESEIFDKGRTLFNLHRAAQPARAARRLIMVEGYFDVIALDDVGIAETVAPMGTALTEAQLERAWRVIERPILLFDGDAAGRKAAMRASRRAMPHLAPGRSLAIALLPEGEDPDTIVRSAEDLEAGAVAIEAVLATAEPLSAWLWNALLADADQATPEGKAALWAELRELAGLIGDDETKAQYLGDWRSRFDAQFPPPPAGLSDEDMLPSGRVATVSTLGEGERARLKSATMAWFDRTHDKAASTPKRANGWVWQLGRYYGSDLIEAELATAALKVLKAELVKAHPEAKWRDVERSYEAGVSKGADIDALLLTMRCAGHDRTDLGNSKRWLDRFGRDFVYTTQKGWLGWDGRRFRVLNQEKDATPAEVLASVVAMVEAIEDESYFVRDTGWPEREELSDKQLDAFEEDPRKPHGMDRLIFGGKRPERLSSKLTAWAIASQASGRINCIAGLVKREVTVEFGEFDTDPMLLNCENGTLRFHPPKDGKPARVELLDHDRAHRLTKMTACPYEPKARAPEYRKLIEWAQPEEGRRRYVQQWMGYGLTGETGAQIFQIWWGPKAANGKSTVANACRGAAGDYGAMTKAETFLEVGARKGADAASPGLAVLPGIRLLVSGEPPKGAQIDEALINTVTGGDEMMARDNFRSFFWFVPNFKWTLSCNKLPPIVQGTAGIWRRVKIVMWDSHLEEHQRDDKMPERLKGEYAGILAWMVRGTLDQLDNGFVEPQSVTEATAEFKDDSDPATRFLRACTVPDENGRVQSSELYEVYTGWAAAADEVVWKQKGFSQALKDKLAKKASNGMFWLGIRLIKQKSDFMDDHGNVRAQPSEGGQYGSASHPHTPGDDEIAP